MRLFEEKQQQSNQQPCAGVSATEDVPAADQKQPTIGVRRKAKRDAKAQGNEMLPDLSMTQQISFNPVVMARAQEVDSSDHQQTAEAAKRAE